jgi:hypothetical protein
MADKLGELANPDSRLETSPDSIPFLAPVSFEEIDIRKGTHGFYSVIKNLTLFYIVSFFLNLSSCFYHVVILVTYKFVPCVHQGTI